MTAVLRLPWGWKLLDLQRDGTQYHEGWYPKDTGTRRVVGVSPHMGMTAAAVLATKMIYSFTPRYLSMVGITAGMRGVCALGDVIAGDPCWDWGSGKYGVRDSKPRFEPAPIQIGLSSYVRGRLGTMARDQAFWDSVRNGWPGEPSDTVLRMLIGPFASSAAVLSDSDVTEGVSYNSENCWRSIWKPMEFWRRRVRRPCRSRADLFSKAWLILLTGKRAI